MPQSSFVERLRGTIRRIFFWLPSNNAEVEQAPEAAHDHALVLSVTTPAPVPRWRQLRYLFRVLSLPERRLFIIACLVCVASLLVAGGLVVQSRLVIVPTIGGIFTEALIGQPKFINPLDVAPNNDIDQDLVHLVYSGLFRFSELKAVPDIAESYEWSDDRKILTVHLRKDARFHDGQPVTPEDVRFTIESIQQPERKSTLLKNFQNITIAIVDDSTVTFTLTRPDPFFLNTLTVGILPAHAWQNISLENARLSDLNIKPIGSGPYRVKSFSRDTFGNIHSYTLEQYDQYYGDKPYLKTISFQFFASQQEALDAFKGDLVDAIAFTSKADSQTGLNSSRFHTVTLDLPEETLAFLNLKDKTLSDPNVRRALSITVQREDLVTAISGQGTVINSPFPFGASSSTIDLDTARQLLTDAGWVLPQNSNIRIWSPAPAPSTNKKKKTTAEAEIPVNTTPIATSSSTELTLTISVPADPDLQTIAEVLKRQWSVIGARVNIESLSKDELMRKATHERKTQITLLNVYIGPSQNLFPFWSSSQAIDRGLNVSGYVDRPTDDALDAINIATSDDAVQTARATAESHIQQASPALFLYRPNHRYLINSHITVPDEHLTIATPADRFAGLFTWYRSTGWRLK